MTLTFHQPKPSHEVAALFVYAASMLALGSAGYYVSGIPDRNAATALEEIVGNHNMDAQHRHLNQDFIAAASARIFPRLTAKNLPTYDYQNLFASEGVVFSLSGLNGAQPAIPFTITSAFSNPSNLYYTVPDETGHTALVQCNAHQWLRVRIDGMVSTEPATISEIVTDCHVVGSGTNPLQAKLARIEASLYQTPAGLRDEVAKATLPVLGLRRFSHTETRVSITLGDFTQAAADIRTIAHRTPHMRLFVNGKSYPCDATSTAISSITLPNRSQVADMGDGFRRRDFVVVRGCG